MDKLHTVASSVDVVTNTGGMLLVIKSMSVAKSHSLSVSSVLTELNRKGHLKHTLEANILTVFKNLLVFSRI